MIEVGQSYIYKFIFDCDNGNKILRRKEASRGRWKEISYKEYCKETNTHIDFSTSTTGKWEIEF